MDLRNTSSQLNGPILKKKKKKMYISTYVNLNAIVFQGLLVSEYEMAGLLLRSADRDDYGDSCQCGPYAATTVIDIGANGELEPLDIVCCNTFALFSNGTQ